MNIKQRLRLWTERGILLIFYLACATALPAPTQSKSAPTPAAAAPVAAFAETIDKITLHHTSWTAKDGAPPYIRALAQTPDGWLWIGASTGLYRFDGVRFESFSMPGQALQSSNVSALKVLPSGAMWVGYFYGGATEIKDGKILHQYPPGDARTAGTVYDFTTDADGQLWVAGTFGLAVLKDGKLQPQARDVISDSAIHMLMDKAGGLWVNGMRGVFYRERGATSFHAVDGVNATLGLIEAADGSILVSDPEHGGIRVLRGPASGAAPLTWRPHKGPNAKIAFDHAGQLWVMREDGVEMLEPGTKGDVAHYMGIQQGLSGETGTAVLVDREGNVWVGTENGLDRFRGNKIKRYPIPTSKSEALPLAVGKDGAIWTDHYLIPDADAAPVLYDPTPVTSSNYLLTAYVDPTGAYWAASPEGVQRVEQTADGFTITPLLMPPKLLNKPSVRKYGLGMDKDGGLWMASSFGVHRWKDSLWEKSGGNKELDKSPNTTTLYVDPSGALWKGEVNSVLMTVADGKARRFYEKDGLELGTIMQVYQGGKTVWAAGENGLAFFDGVRFHMVTGTDGEAFRSTSGIAQTPDGDLWLNSGVGIFRIPSQEQARLLTAPGYRVRFERLGHEDGLLGVAPQLGSIRSAVAAKGKVWFSTTNGLFWIDPVNALRNALAPPVVIKQIQADGKSWQPQPDLVLPEGTHQLNIDYTALSLTMPERMRFRYRLEGADTEWQEAGTRRAAFYTNLSPGNYRFQVVASNNDGVWNNTGDTLVFSIKPMMVQTWWFKTLCALAFFLLIWLLHRRRLRQVANRVRERLEERIDERERIARELHDTLLQSIQGMVLTIHAAVMRLPAKDDRARIEQALQLADIVIAEGRDRVTGLRHAGDIGDLFLSLKDEGEQLAAQGDTVFSARMVGEPRCLHTIVNEEFYAIGRETLLNAFHHAGAAAIELQVQYGARELRLMVRDNGCGIPAEVQKRGGRSGHWGLPGMYERADKIKARLLCHSNDGSGTEWVLVLPAQLAYQPNSGESVWHRLINRFSNGSPGVG